MGLTMGQFRTLEALLKKQSIPPFKVETEEQAQLLREWDEAMGVNKRHRHDWKVGDEYYRADQFMFGGFPT